MHSFIQTKTSVAYYYFIVHLDDRDVFQGCLPSLPEQGPQLKGLFVIQCDAICLTIIPNLVIIIVPLIVMYAFMNLFDDSN